MTKTIGDVLRAQLIEDGCGSTQVREVTPEALQAAAEAVIEAGLDDMADSVERQRETDNCHWAVGKAYFIRTVTHYLTGKLVKVTPTELVLLDAAWVASTGRFADAIRTGELDEVEPYPDSAVVIVGRGALIDAVRWTHPLPREQK